VTAVHVVVPAGVHDPVRVSGGNRYDLEVCGYLRGTGWTVTEIAAGGTWPRPDSGALAALARSLDAVGDGALVLVDGLIASAARPVLVPHARRLRLVVLVHMIFGRTVVPEGDESAVLTAARAVVTTSAWTRARLLERYPLAPGRVHVAHPGTDPAPVSPPTPGGGRLLCVGTLSPIKGQDLLVDALGTLTDLPWGCTLVGPLDRDPGFVARLTRRAAASGIADRIRLTGTRTGAALRRSYAAADLLVVPSRAETYGMVVPEALAAGVPVVASTAGGLPEALGDTPDGVPGLLVPVGDAPALATALAGWLTGAGLRRRLRVAALRRRAALRDWWSTGVRIADVLAAVRAEPGPPEIRVVGQTDGGRWA
jgi:glycosyltransferase involved in cell wall biosynthesis